MKILSYSRINELKLMKHEKKNIQYENAKQHQQRIKNLDGKTKKNIKDENTKQHQQRRKNFDETTKDTKIK